jgi:hypothetical protein
MKERAKDMGKNPYATNRGGRIEAPNRPDGEPRPSVIRSGEDLRK